MLSYRSLARRAAIFVLGHVLVLGAVGFLAMTAGSADSAPKAGGLAGAIPADITTGSIRQP